MVEKRKNVVFAQDTTVHPSRRMAIDGASTPDASPATPKVKTVAKQRYLKKEARKRKVRVAAKKASAPKSKGGIGGEQDQRDAVPANDTAASVRNEAHASPKIETSSTDLPAGLGDETARTADATLSEKELRKLEKRAKRANRRIEQDVVQAEDVEMEDQPVAGPSRQSSAVPSEIAPSPSIRSSSPPTPPLLEAFPLPTAAPAPQAAVLSRQGLPAGLENATFVDQTTTIAVEAFGREDGADLLSSGMRKRLDKMGIKEFFAVQSAMLPHLLREKLDPPSIPSDYLVSAPTGSGKTLAYCVPLVEVLSKRQITRLRAVIVLPTRELVNQVKDVLDGLVKGTGLKVAAISGQQSFAHEQSMLVPITNQKLVGGSSSVDILVATPGRLIDHLTSTQNFSLQHLRFLIIDEADRLLNQSFQSWLSTVSSHIYPPAHPTPLETPPQPWDSIAPAWMETYGLVDINDPYRERFIAPCQKLLFSATLTRDPSKIAALSLRNPQYYIVQSASLPAGITSIGEQFAVPEGLTEKMIVLPPALKPLNLIHLLYAFSVRNALIFTKSVEAALRLQSLLAFFQDAWMGEKLVPGAYTAEMKPGERRKALKDFEAGKIDLLICSDLVARGIDLPSTSHVVSYDVPLDMRKYVHRVGRTARAGRSGTAWTLVEKQEALRFKSTLKAAGHERNVKKVKVKEEDLEPYQESYKIAMTRFSEKYSRS